MHFRLHNHLHETWIKTEVVDERSQVHGSLIICTYCRRGSMVLKRTGIIALCLCVGVGYAHTCSCVPVDIFLKTASMETTCVMVVVSLNHVRLFETPRTVAFQSVCPWNFPGKNSGEGCYSFSRGSSWLRDQTHVTCVAGRFFYCWATKEALIETTYQCNRQVLIMEGAVDGFATVLLLIIYIKVSSQLSQWFITHLEHCKNVSIFLNHFIVTWFIHKKLYIFNFTSMKVITIYATNIHHLQKFSLTLIIILFLFFVIKTHNIRSTLTKILSILYNYC